MDSVATLGLRVSSDQATAALDKFGGALDGVKSKALSLTSSLLSIGNAKMLIAAAAEGQEAFGKYEDILGRFTKRADSLVNNLRASFNFDTATAQQSIATMVDLFVKSGTKLEDALGYTSDLQKRAADLEAFTNAADGLAGVTNALTTGMLGNAMPLKRLGIVMNEEAIKAQMAQDKLEGLTFATERAAKMHARYAIILQQSKSAAGQVARESDNYSNKLRKLRGVVSDLQGELGDVLIPIATKIVDITTKAARAVEGTSPTTKKLIVGFGAAVGAATALSTAFFGLIFAANSYSVASNMAAQFKAKETKETQVETASETANATATNAATVAKEAETAARLSNVAAINAENAALATSNRAQIGNAVAGRLPIGGASKKLGGVANAIATQGAGNVVGKAASKTLGKSAVATLGGNAAGALGKSTGIFSKILSGLAKPFKFINGKFAAFAAILGNLVGKLPIIGQFGMLITGVGTKFLPIVGWVSTVIAALKGLKKLPEMTEAFIEEIWPRIQEFGAELPGMIWEGIKKGWAKLGEGLKAVEGWFVDAGKGLVQTFARIGGQTEATDRYRTNKLMKDANEQHEKLLEVQRKQLKAQSEAYAAEKTMRQQELASRAKYAIGKSDDETRRAAANLDLHKNEAQQADLKRRIEEQKSVLANARNDQNLVAQQKAQFDKEIGERYKNAVNSTEARALWQKKKLVDAEFDKKIEELEGAQQDAVDFIKSSSDELGGLSEAWLELAQNADELESAVEDARDAVAKDQADFAKLGEENRKRLEADARQAALDAAKTPLQRRKALQDVLDAAGADIEESREAQAVAAQRNAQMTAINARLHSDGATSGLAYLTSLSQGGIDENEARLQYGGVLDQLRSAGYRVDRSFNEYSEENVVDLLEEINEQRKNEAKELARLAQERDEASSIAGELSTRIQAQRSARQALDDELKAQETARLDDQKALEERESAARDRERERSKTFNNELYSRQLSAISDYAESGAPGARYDATLMKYDLVSANGAGDWNASQEVLGELGGKINDLSTEIERIARLEQTGQATDEDRQKRRELESKRDQLQTQYESESDKATQALWGVEKELSTIEKEAQKERDATIRDYVTEQGNALKKNLEAQAKAFEEMQQKELQERSEVEKEQRQAIAGAKAVATGTSEAFNIQSKIYDRGQLELPPIKKIENATGQIEKYVAQMQESLYQYLSGNTGVTFSVGY